MKEHETTGEAGTAGEVGTAGAAGAAGAPGVTEPTGPSHASADPRARVLITVDELAERVGGEGAGNRAGDHPSAGGADAPVLLDVRWHLQKPDGRDDFAAGHIPGARYVALDTELADHANTDRREGRHPLPTVEAFESTVHSWGVGTRSSVVIYDDVAGQGAARAWWMLRWVGHEDVRVLDGGWTAWKDAGLPVETGNAGSDAAASAERSGPATADGDHGGAEAAGAASADAETGEAETGDDRFIARPGGMPILTADEASDLARTGVLLDARAPERFEGRTEPMDPVAGHIPGALNAPAGGNTAGVHFRSPEELLAAYREVGAVPGAPDAEAPAPVVGAYCGSGVSASHTVLTLASLGVEAALFPGSWSAWSNDPTRPVATGTADDETVHPPRA